MTKLPYSILSGSLGEALSPFKEKSCVLDCQSMIGVECCERARIQNDYRILLLLRRMAQRSFIAIVLAIFAMAVIMLR